MLAAGMRVWKTEIWNSWAKIRQDMFGFADYLGFDPHTVTLVQTTTASHVSERLKKILANSVAYEWVQGQGREIEVHGWEKKQGRWEPRIIPVTADDFDVSKF